MSFPWEQILTSVVTIIVAILGSQGLWSYIQSKSKSSNQAILDKIDALENRLEASEMDRSRERVLKFNREILSHEKHTAEEFNDVLISINNYESYCRTHKDYLNNRAVLAIENIKKVYQKCMETDDFL